MTPLASGRRASHRLTRRPDHLVLIAVLFLAVFYVVPLALILVGGASTPAGWSLAGYLDDLTSPAFLTIIWRTIRISAIAALIALLLGYPYAYLLLRLPPRMVAVFSFIAVAPFFTSILIRTYAWVAILADNGLVNELLLRLGLTGSPVPLVYNETGTLIGMTQVQLPLMIFTLYGAMRRIDLTLLSAAGNLGADPIAAFCRVFLPLSWPGVAAGCSLVFTTALGFYVTPALLGGPGQYVVTQSIYQQVAAVGDLQEAGRQAAVLLVIVLALLLVLQRFLAHAPAARFRGAAAGAGRSGAHGGLSWQGGLLEAVLWRIRPALPAIAAALRGTAYLLFAFTAVLLLAPLLVVLPIAFSDQAYLSFPPHGFSWRWIRAYLGDRSWLASTWFSLWISLGAALLASAIGTLAAYGMSRRRGRRWPLEIFFVSPMIVPQFVIALAMYFIIVKLHVVGQPLTFIIAYAVFGFPLVFLILYATFQRFDHSLTQVAASLGARPLGTWRQIVVPLVAPAFWSALFFAFLVAFDDLVVGLFFSTADSYTLAMRMWDDIRLEISPRIAAVTVVVLGAAILLFLVVRATSLVHRELQRKVSRHAAAQDS